MPKGLLAGVAGIALVGAALPAIAQQQAASTAASPSTAPEGSRLTEVVVTAMRRPEVLREVPLSVTAVDSKVLADRHITDPSEIVFAAPSLQVESNNDSPVASFFSIRGVGTQAFVKFIEQSVGVNLDGVALVRPETGVLAFYDINDVEVLNGPQGILFGKNASAGLVNITTRNPEIGKFDGYVDTELGSMTTPGGGIEYQAQGVVNIPVTENSALRITGVYLHTDPLVEDVYTTAGQQYGHDEGGVRVKYLWNPTSALSITLSGDYAHSEGIGAGETTDRVLAPGSVNAVLDGLVGITPGPNNVYNSSNAPTQDRFSSGGAQANVVYTFPNGGSLTNILAWRKYEEHGIADNDDHQINVEDSLGGYFDFSQISEELRYASPLGRKLEYQAGVYFLSARIYEAATVFGNLGMPAPPPPFVAIVGADGWDLEHLDSVAVFGQATYHVTDQFRVVAGARFTHDYVDNASASYETAAVVQALGVFTNPKTSVTDNNVSWRGSLQYDVTPDVMGYLTAASGYKGPGFNQFSTLSVPAEISYQYEAGLKTRLFDRRVAFSLAVFDEVFDHSRTRPTSRSRRTTRC